MVVFAASIAMLLKSMVDSLGNKSIKDSNGENTNLFYILQSLTMGIILLLLWIVGMEVPNNGDQE